MSEHFMKDYVKEILFTEEEIQWKVAQLGKQITEDYKGKEVVFVGILKGSFMFMADLVRAVDLFASVDFMVVSSYGDSTVTSGQVMILKDLGKPIENKHVIIVEDILDTGTTLSYLKKILNERHPASLKICTLLDKPERRNPELNIVADYAGFSVGNQFVIGYGLDYAEKFRNLPFIGIAKEDIISDVK